jgi:glycosyltransferase involved in cell wall biosynthesis
MKTLALFPYPQIENLERVREGSIPDTNFMGLNYFPDFGSSVEYLDPHDNFLSNPIRRLTGIDFGRNIIPQLKMLYQAKNYDCVVLRDIRNTLISLPLKRFLINWKKPVIVVDVSVHEKQRYRRILHYILSPADKLIYNTSTIGDNLRNLLNIDQRKLSCIPWGVDKDFFEPFDIPTEDFVLSVGNTNRDYKTLIGALDGRIYLKIVTSTVYTRFDMDAWDLDALKRRVSEKVEVISTDQRKLKELYAEARLVVIPVFSSTTAAGVTSLLESMAMGKATLVTDSPGLRDYVRDWKDAVFVAPRDGKDLKKKVDYLLEDPDECMRIGKNARKAVENNFNTFIEGRKIYDIIRELVA